MEWSRFGAMDIAQRPRIAYRTPPRLSDALRDRVRQLEEECRVLEKRLRTRSAEYGALLQLAATWKLRYMDRRHFFTRHEQERERTHAHRWKRSSTCAA